AMLARRSASVRVSGPYCSFFAARAAHRYQHSFPTRRSSDLKERGLLQPIDSEVLRANVPAHLRDPEGYWFAQVRRHVGAEHLGRSEEHTSELQSRENLVCRLLLEKKKRTKIVNTEQRELQQY